MSAQLRRVLFAYLMNGMHCEIISYIGKSADVSGQASPRCCSDSATGEMILNSTELICVQVNQLSLKPDS